MGRIKTLTDIENRRIVLERSMKLKQFEAKNTVANAGSELPRFILKKVALPAALIALAAMGISKFTESSEEEPVAVNYEAPPQDDQSVSILMRAWLFALPFIQGFVKDFVSQKINEFRQQ
ncbi:MAG: hypothetical protein AAF847_02960 [Bacteroidota bacterium]